ncbi:MAG: GntR family transcriptional regulator [Pseudorhodobacter sp.]
MEPMRRPVSQPLHRQIRDLLLGRIQSGDWPPGTYLPSESRLAEDYAVALGTIRKALLDLAQEGIVLRRQGKGTVVASHDGDETLFRFLNLRRADGSRVRPESRVLSVSRGTATEAEFTVLRLNPDAQVIRIARVREVDGRAVIHERVSIGADRFAGLEARADVLPNTLYQLYQRGYGQTVHQAEEALTALPADAEVAAALGITPGAPCLNIRRIASDYQGQPLELRVSVIVTDALYYACTL